MPRLAKYLLYIHIYIIISFAIPRAQFYTRATSLHTRAPFGHTRMHARHLPRSLGPAPLS